MKDSPTTLRRSIGLVEPVSSEDDANQFLKTIVALADLLSTCSDSRLRPVTPQLDSDQPESSRSKAAHFTPGDPRQ